MQKGTIKSPFMQGIETVLNKLYAKIRKKLYLKSHIVKRLKAIANAVVRKKHSKNPLESIAPRRNNDEFLNWEMKCITDFLINKGWIIGIDSRANYQIDPRYSFVDIFAQIRTTDLANWDVGSDTNGILNSSATMNGKSIIIEIKVACGKLSEAQRKYKSTIEKADGIFFFAHDFAGFSNWYNNKFGSHEWMDKNLS